MQKANYQSRPNRFDGSDNQIFGLLNVAINRKDLPPKQKSFIKRKVNGSLIIIKVVNNLLRSTVVITYTPSLLNKQNEINVFYKRYRKNTVDKFGQSCRVTTEKKYDLMIMNDCTKLVNDIEQHMTVTPDNLKTVNEPLPVRMGNFTEIDRKSLFAFEIHAFSVNKAENPIDGTIDLTLVSNNLSKDLTVNIADIVNFNDISDLIGKWVILNHKGSFKIKTKEDIYTSYNVIG